jgi:predicted Zn-dependent peptidase
MTRTNDPRATPRPMSAAPTATAPATTEPAAGPMIPFLDERLPNGLRYVISEDHLAPVVAVNVQYAVGSKDEVAGKTGFAHLFEHIMFQGSRHVAKTEHQGLIQGAGGTNNGTTWLDRTNYFETMPSHQLELALWAEADRMATLLDALSQENLDNQRDVVKNERRLRYDNQPYGVAWEKLQAAVFPQGHGYHHSPIGSMADLDAASLHDVRAFFSAYYAPNNATVAIVGDVDPAEVHAWLARYFGPIPPTSEPPPRPNLSLPALIGTDHREVVPDSVPLPRAYLGMRAPVWGDPAFDALEVGSQILAGGKASRLYHRLVREERIAQDVSANPIPFTEGASLFVLVATASSGIEIEQLEEAAWQELERIAFEPVTSDELARAKALLETAELSALQHVEERADRLAMYAQLFDDPGRINHQLARYLAVDAEAVRAAAEAVFRTDNRAAIVYVPE